MEGEYLTIAQAAELTNKSQASIRRLVKNLLVTDATTPFIQRKPLPNGSEQYLISKAYLTDPATQPDTQSATQPDSQTATQPDSQSSALIDVLFRQLDEKDHQIQSLLERLHEQNVLIGNMQNRLLPPGTTSDLQPGEPQPEQPTKRRRLFGIF